ncbi:non-lysosomal glucosylceramidase isoform X2 [Pectinophora gossypiella]|uniref:non-lysosomal glucosylceramidase isoform X2 n=1 Tax=Pectinophora gossypiella TaxID=13191 RepID=UPI00214ECB87|nr:non-lysosomal glucosylceramidase isoform X2 [Pectinophora gossypiella]
MEMETIGDQATKLDDPPKYGLKLPLDHVFPLQTKQIIVPKANQILEMMPLTVRYLKYYLGKKMHKKRPIMDYINMISAQRMYGCPIGGIGSGTIGRGFKGEFCRFQMFPGLYQYVTVPECQFIVNIRNANKETIFQSVLSTYDKPKKAPASWEWNLKGANCEYTALYPRAWTTYDLSEYGVKLVCRQVSPVVPHNYKDSSLPCAVFVFTAENVCDEHRDVNITFTWTEVLADPRKKKSAIKLDLERYSEDQTCGVTLDQKILDQPCTFTIAKTKNNNETIHEGYCLWNAAKTSAYVWQCMKEHGRLYPDPSLTPPPPKVPDKSESKDEKKKSEKEKQQKQKKMYKCDSIALSSSLSLKAGATGMTEFCLAWDMPVIKYAKDKTIRKRFYTRFFGSDGIAGASIAGYALRNYRNWERQLIEWQNPILNNSNIPDWLKSALMNELYFIADGGTIWFDGREDFPEGDPRHDFGLFGYLEGHEYRMYNTYDVHFYASFALAQLWPNLQVVLQYMYRDTIALESEKSRKSLYNGKNVKYKVKESIPHDLGDPDDVPFTNINCYNIHDVSEWRDLNLKFVLQVCRDLRILRAYAAPFGNERSTASEVQESEVRQEPRESVTAVWDSRRYLNDMYPSCCALLRRALSWDADGDGLIENSGSPDQTFDAWVMTGPSAYCGGLWLAALSGVRHMARLLEKEDDEREFGKLLDQAQHSFHDKLWNGTYYLFDTKPSNRNVVMADQLAGQWFLRASGSSDQVFPESNVRKSLGTIYENNVQKFVDGKMGAVNGWVLEGRGRIDTTALQSEEMWTGVTYGLASLMIFEGMHEEAFVTAGGMYKTLTDMGLAFETPEALYENGNHRSIAYMRPLAIWGMYQAIVNRPPPPAPVANGQLKHAKENAKL